MGTSWFLEHPGRPMLSQWMVDSKGRVVVSAMLISSLYALFLCASKATKRPDPLKKPKLLKKRPKIL